MANTLDLMDIKQIITLHLDHYSNRKIAGTLGISRNTVNTYLHLFHGCKYSLEELLQLDQTRFNTLFASHTTIVNERYNELMLYFEKVNLARNHPGFTFLYHYDLYKEQSKNPYSYTQFMEHYNRKYARIKGSMKLEHQAGNEIFIDFAGKKLQITDRDTGEIKQVEVFIAILPHSHYTYVEACYSQQREDLIKCVGNALSFYGGVPKAIVSDNLKSAVTRASKYEPLINRAFKDFARHFNCVINPTRGYSPQDKALVENAVQLTYQRIYYPIRNMTFFTLEELNREIRKRLESYNNMLLQRKEISRKELFQSVERGYLKPLPEGPYQIKQYTRAKVQKIGYIYFSPDKSYYSVPYRYIGKSTQIQYTANTVEVYYNHERIALHKRNPEKGIYITNREHLSSSHQAYVDWSPEYFMKMATKHGHAVLTYVKQILGLCDYPETAYKSIMGIIQLHKIYGSERLNNACERAIFANRPSYRMVKNILKNNLDKETNVQQELNLDKPHIPEHENIRGASNYK
ncbi:MAG TPA: IS21 family transposase [Bacteroidales bacterium]|nr:IS21 family transposase [Bacteroidales bacterium]